MAEGIRTESKYHSDPVLTIFLSGQAETLEEAEDRYLDETYPELLELLNGPATQEELDNHPLIIRWAERGNRRHPDLPDVPT